MADSLVQTPTTTAIAELSEHTLFTGKRRIAVFFDADTPEKYTLLSAAVTDDGPPNWPSFVGRTVTCIGIAAWTRKVSKADEPEKWSTYLALLTEDGQYIRTAGTGPMEDLPLVASKFGLPPWPDGVPITLVKNGRRFGMFPGWAPDKIV